ncbi:MAG TPA: prolyl oligopeptidase family serine peptidase [Gaiellaceae bacterium]|nr:prolyl oligopeptidase family serine peptidase [Gaiellaceae bacterium]
MGEGDSQAAGTIGTGGEAPPLWEQRFRAPVSFLPTWSPEVPDRLLYASNESGVWQLHAWELGRPDRRRVTDSRIGVIDGMPTFDGEGIVWFADESGDESGHWLVQPYSGGESVTFLPGAPEGWSGGLAQAPGIVATAVSGRDGFAVYVALDDEPPHEIYRSTEAVTIGGLHEGGFVRGGLSADGSLLCLEHGDLIHPALLVLDPRTGETLGEQLDTDSSLAAKCWSPVKGDQRLALDHELEGEWRPALWELATGERRNLEIGLTGEVRVLDWWPDGSALLLKHLVEGRHRLLRFDLAGGEPEVVETEPGVILTARVRPDGRVWLLHEQGHRSRRVLDDTGAEVLRLHGAEALPARPYRSWHFPNPKGDRVHGFYVTPSDTGGPFPVVMLVHGGPTAADLDSWKPEVQAYVDAGFAVGLVNYRGSTGYGREWRDTLIGDIGGPELEDVNAGLSNLVEQRIADPERAVVAGHSWGGYVTLLELGKHPQLWACGVAGVPVGDYEAGYEDLSPLLQAYDRALLGGAPSEVPDLMRDRNPINFADRVRAPVLFLIGKNDSRCPYRQAMLYVERLAERGHPHDVYVFSAGHSAFDIGERIRQVARILAFLDDHVPGLTASQLASAADR